MVTGNTASPSAERKLTVRIVEMERSRQRRNNNTKSLGKTLIEWRFAVLAYTNHEARKDHHSHNDLEQAAALGILRTQCGVL